MDNDRKSNGWIWAIIIIIIAAIAIYFIARGKGYNTSNNTDTSGYDDNSTSMPLPGGDTGSTGGSY